MAADIEGVKEKLTALNGDYIRLEAEIKRVSGLAESYEKILSDSGEEEKKLREKGEQADKELDKTLKDTAEVDKKILEKDLIFTTSKAYISYDRCIGSNVDINGICPENQGIITKARL